MFIKMNRKRSKISKRLKRSKKKHSRKHRKSHKRNFGSMFGLQGSDTHYSGVYPMNMKYNGDMPNLYNVKRDYHV
jgi:hypothetical protein